MQISRLRIAAALLTAGFCTLGTLRSLPAQDVSTPSAAAAGPENAAPENPSTNSNQDPPSDPVKPNETPAKEDAAQDGANQDGATKENTEKSDSPKQESEKKETESKADTSDAPASDKTEKPSESKDPKPESKPKNPPADKKDAASDEAQEPKMKEAKGDDAKPKRENKKPEPPAEPAKLPNIGRSDGPSLPGQPWRVHDRKRPQPRPVTPGTPSTYDAPGTPPSDAIVLFNGEDLSMWAHIGPDSPDDLREPQWKVEENYFEVVPRTGTLESLDSFGSCQLHIEWQAPAVVRGNGQGRGNSGIKLMGIYEVQVLDSYNNRTYADGHAGAMYGQYPPMVNATRPPGEWQIYDIIFEAPQLNDDGSIKGPAYLTLLHNGILLHHRRPFYGPTGAALKLSHEGPPAAPLTLQDHGNPVRYRNIWVRPLDL